MKASIRPLAARALQTASLWSGDAQRRARAVQQPRILMYHGIGPADVPADVFIWQLRWIKREFEIVSLRELVRRQREGRIGGREVVITFDDGVRNHGSAAYPILAAEGVAATFFVCPGLAGSGRWIWNMELRLRLHLLSASERAALAHGHRADAADVEGLVGWAKRQRGDKRRAFEAAAAALTREFEPTAEQIDRNAPMAWEDLARLDPALITIGSHTVTHPILTTLDADEKRSEIAGSRAELEVRLARQVDLFCYPNGDNDAGAAETVRNAYEGAVTTQAGFVRRDADPMLLPRIAAGETRALFVRRMHRPGA